MSKKEKAMRLVTKVKTILKSDKSVPNGFEYDGWMVAIIEKDGERYWDIWSLADPDDGFSAPVSEIPFVAIAQWVADANYFRSPAGRKTIFGSK